MNELHTSLESAMYKTTRIVVIATAVTWPLTHAYTLILNLLFIPVNVVMLYTYGRIYTYYVCSCSVEVHIYYCSIKMIHS